MFLRLPKLDLFNYENNDHLERQLLRKTLIESEPVTKTTATYCLNRMDRTDGLYEFIKDISEELAVDNISKKVINSFKTIYAYENLTSKLTFIFYKIVLNTFDNGGMLNLDEMDEEMKEEIINLRDNKFVEALRSSPQFIDLISYYYGAEFSTLLQDIVDSPNCEAFIRSLIRYHLEVMKKRKSAAWLDMEVDEVRSNFGYDYAKNYKGNMHGYKISNLFSIIQDTGWQL